MPRPDASARRQRHGSKVGYRVLNR